MDEALLFEARREGAGRVVFVRRLLCCGECALGILLNVRAIGLKATRRVADWAVRRRVKGILGSSVWFVVWDM